MNSKLTLSSFRANLLFIAYSLPGPIGRWAKRVCEDREIEVADPNPRLSMLVGKLPPKTRFLGNLDAWRTGLKSVDDLCVAGRFTPPAAPDRPQCQIRRTSALP